MSTVNVRAAVALFENGEYIVMGVSPFLDGEAISDDDMLAGLKEASESASGPYTIRRISAVLELPEPAPEIEATEEATS